MVKRQEDGILLVELFESEGPSLNVQFLKMNWAQLDESQRSLFCANFTSSSSDDFGLSPTQRSNNLPLTSNYIRAAYFFSSHFISLLRAHFLGLFSFQSRNNRLSIH